MSRPLYFIGRDELDHVDSERIGMTPGADETIFKNWANDTLFLISACDAGQSFGMGISCFITLS